MKKDKSNSNNSLHYLDNQFKNGIKEHDITKHDITEHDITKYDNDGLKRVPAIV